MLSIVLLDSVILNIITAITIMILFITTNVITVFKTCSVMNTIRNANIDIRTSKIMFTITDIM